MERRWDAKTALTNKPSDVPKYDPNLPSFEIQCLGRMGIMVGSRHRKGDPVVVIEDGSLEPIELSDETQQRSFEEYANSICTRYGLKPYLHDGNGDSRSKNKGENQDHQRYDDDGIPLGEDLAQMLKKGLGFYDEKVVIVNGTRHNVMLKVANSILFRYSDNEDLRVLKDWFILINEHCCKPNPLSNTERDHIWNDAVEYVSRKKAEESNRILTVSDAIREGEGEGKIVRGIVASVSTPFKVYFRMAFRCLNCQTINEAHKLTRGPAVYPQLQFREPRKCLNCEEDELTEYDSVTDVAKIITLQNIDLTNSELLDETLEVLLIGDNTKYTRAGEVVTISGTLYFGISNIGTPSKGRKHIALMEAKFVTYEDRQNFVITERDIKSFYRFVSISTPNVLDRLVSMTAPNIIGEYDGKLGGLRSIVGGCDFNKRGRIHSLYVGDKGLAKTTLIYEFTKMHPNSRFITAHTASSKSALGIVEANGDTKTLIYGPIPLSSGSVVGIDELQTWIFDEQGSLLGVMEHGKFVLLKYGKDRPIKAETTIVATVNPQDVQYTNRKILKKDEITLLPPLLDRFDQIFVSLDNRTEADDRTYADTKFRNIDRRIDHNYNFIIKYLSFAKTLQPVWNPEAQSMIKEYWIRMRVQKLAGNRTLESIIRITETTAKLKLKTEIDSAIATEAMGSIERELMQQGESIKAVEDPRDIFIRAASDIVENTKAPIAFEEITNYVCREYPQVNAWLYGGSNRLRNTAYNRRYRELHDRFLLYIQKSTSNIVIKCMKPLVVVWQTSAITSESTIDIIATIDTIDTKRDSDNSKTVPGISEENSLSNMSNMSNMSIMPTYEYLKETDSYRCLECRCIYFADRKDSKEAHPCNNNVAVAS